MQENYSSSKFPTDVTTFGASKSGTAAAWTDPLNITADDTNSAVWQAFEGGQESNINGLSFGFPKLPPSAVVDGINVFIEGSQFSAFGTVGLNISGSTTKPIGALNGSFGGPNDKWGLATITPAHIANLAVSVSVGDVSGGDARTTIEHMLVTVYWHIEPIAVPPKDVPTRLAYKVYSREGRYLGELPTPSSRLNLPQEINSSGTALDISVPKDLRNVTKVEPLLTENDLDILTEDGQVIYSEFTELLITAGNSEDEALFKNSNRIRVYLYNYWHPNGKLIFSGQVNRISFSYGAASSYVNLRVFSDGYDLANYIARGFPFNYTNDQFQGVADTVRVVKVGNGTKEGGIGHDVWGQTWRTGAGVTNLGAVTLRFNGTATVTVYIYDAVGGDKIGEATQNISTAGWQNIKIEMPQLIEMLPDTTYFLSVWVNKGQSIELASAAADNYTKGSLYRSLYSGGSGGGGWEIQSGDLFFTTASGVPTTKATYNSQDPITSTMDKILTDYNNRGGKIKRRNFQAAGYNISYTFNMSTILDVMKKVVELSPRGFYSYVDLGTASLDILKASSMPDFTVVKGRDIQKLDIALTIEQVKNYLLFSGGDTGAGENLFRDYQARTSTANYGLRTVTQSDNRVTVPATADALGQSFIDEHSEEEHETQITVSNKNIDITLLTPGKTVGFKNFGNFIDDLVLQIVRREYNPDSVTLTLGRLPLTLSAEVQRINRELLDEQTAKNPASPS